MSDALSTQPLLTLPQAMAALAARAKDAAERMSQERDRQHRARRAAEAALSFAGEPGWKLVLAGRQSRLLGRSGLFLPAWYRHQYQLTAEADPLRHYIERGIDADLAPNPFFDPAWYSARHLIDRPAVVPIWHYLELGAAAAYATGPLFDALTYVRLNADLAAEPDLLAHLLRRGLREGRPFFVEPQEAALATDELLLNDEALAALIRW